MGGAHPMMHGPWRANLERSINCKQSATPPETPPRHVGNKIVLRCSRFWSANQIAKMRNLASYFLASNRCAEDRIRFPTSTGRLSPARLVIARGRKFGLNGGLTHLESNTRETSNTRAAAPRESVW